MASTEIRRGVTEVFALRFIDSSDPPRAIDFTGSAVAVEIVSGDVRLKNSTADGTTSHRDPYDAMAADDPTTGIIAFELSVDETWSLMTVPSRLEVRREIGGNVESLIDMPILVTDSTGTKGL